MTDEEWVKRFVPLKQEALRLISATLEQVPSEPCTYTARAQIEQKLREMATALWKRDKQLSGEPGSPRVVAWMESLPKIAEYQVSRTIWPRSSLRTAGNRSAPGAGSSWTPRSRAPSISS